MNTQIIKAKDFGLEDIQAKQMTTSLNTTIEEREILKDAYLDVISLDINEENLFIFKELRLKIVKNRTQGIEKWHKTNKAFFLAGGRFVDAIKNKEIIVNQEMESKLMDAEKHFENLEKERIAQLSVTRKALILEFEEVDTLKDLGLMNDDIWQNVFAGAKANFNARKEAKEKALAELEKERKEDLRLAKIEKERQEAIAKENAKLKADAAAREKSLELERLEAKQLADDEAKKQALILNEQRKESQRLAKIEADKQAKIQAIKDAELKKEREEKAKLQAEIKAKRDAEIEAENKKLELERLAKLEAEKLAKAPIKKQLSIWVESFELPDLKTDNEKAILIKSKFEAFKKWASTQVNDL
jgi:colicin import membrane protein